jgi:YVTN family beta-propeller protein
MLMTWFGTLACSSIAMAWPQEVGPFAYVGNVFSGSISVINTSANKVATSIPVGVASNSAGVAVSPDGKFVYVGNGGGVSVIDASSNTVVGSPIPVAGGAQMLAVTPNGKFIYVGNGSGIWVIDRAAGMVVGSVIPTVYPAALAVRPDGKFVYVAGGQSYPGAVSVIDTSSNKVVNTITMDDTPAGIAVTPDGKYAYVSNQLASANNVWVFDTASNAVVATIYAGLAPAAIAVTPNGKFVYVVNTWYNGTVTVIAAATNTVVGNPIPMGLVPQGLVVTPDGKFVYVANETSNTLSVIDTTSNMVTGNPIPVGNGPFGIAMIPPSPGLPFNSFKIEGLDVVHGAAPSQGSFDYYSQFTLGAASNGIKPDVEPVTLEIGGFTTTIPAGSLTKAVDGSYVFLKWIKGILYNCDIRPQGGSLYLIHLSETGLNLPAITNPVQVRQVIGDGGVVTVKAILK